MTTKIKEFKGELNPIFRTSDPETVESPPVATQEASKVTNEIPINLIIPRDDQPRKFFDESSLEELTQSIVSQGVIQPIIVRVCDNGCFEIIVGERRWRAAKRAGLDCIPAIVRDYNNSETLAVTLIENIQRENLNPLEEADAIRSLLESFSMTHEQVAEKIGKSRTAVSNLLRLQNLEDEVKKMLKIGLLEMGHARALLSLDYQAQISAAKQVVARSLSVRETEQLVQRINNSTKSQVVSLAPDFKKKTDTWKNHLSNQLSTRVNVIFGTDGKGKVVIHFDSVQKADWLLDHIRVVEAEVIKGTEK